MLNDWVKITAHEITLTRWIWVSQYPTVGLHCLSLETAAEKHRRQGETLAKKGKGEEKKREVSGDYSRNPSFQVLTAWKAKITRSPHSALTCVQIVTVVSLSLFPSSHVPFRSSQS